MTGRAADAAAEAKAAARWYRVEGPVFIEPGGSPGDHLEVVLQAAGSVRIPAADEGKAREGAAAPLLNLGANALLDCRWNPKDRKSTRLNSSHRSLSRMPSSA